jgi:3',5'-cyclic AMP phosphodiesterase CpdA
MCRRLCRGELTLGETSQPVIRKEIAVSKLLRMIAAGSAVAWLVLGAPPSARRMGRMFAPMVLVSLLGSLLTLGCAPERPPGPPSGVIVAAGDIADCLSEGDEATARLLSSIQGTVLTLGDNAYENGTAQDFSECYEPTWGEFKERTKPVPGNHEYHTAEAEGYFSYFGDAAGQPGKGYYSYDLGQWHIVALNSNCEELGCQASSPQLSWLKADLAKDTKSCTLAYFHYPLFSSGKYRPGIQEVKPLWDALYAADADVVLNGHDHNYQRFAPQDPNGEADPEGGIREFVVGTGGKSHYPILGPIANSEVYNDETYGVLKLTLRPEGYQWRFIPVEGETFTDSGSARCQ